MCVKYQIRKVCGYLTETIYARRMLSPTRTYDYEMYDKILILLHYKWKTIFNYNNLPLPFTKDKTDIDLGINPGNVNYTHNKMLKNCIS